MAGPRPAAPETVGEYEVTRPWRHKHFFVDEEDIDGGESELGTSPHMSHAELDEFRRDSISD